MAVGGSVAGAVIAALAVFAPALPASTSATSTESFAQQARQTLAHARVRIARTESATPHRLYAYYTIGDGWKYTGRGGWAAGFVPAALWSCYQLSGKEWWREHAVSREAAIGRTEISADSLNLGALFFPSFARGYTLTGDPALKAVALAAARSMALRYDPVVGAMLSRPGPEFNVITDSLMKSQLLWWAAKHGGPPEDVEIARRHALTIARDLVRPDGSLWHIVYYDTLTGLPTHRAAGAGYSEDSTWARGQAWAMLGFAAAYRETRESTFLATARQVADWYLANVPEDMIPYWDFGAPDIPAAPRDSSAAAIAASALADLALTDPDPAHGARYLAAAEATLTSLMTPSYLSLESNPAVLLHGTYSWRSGITDRGLAYGDAFFLEALLRLRRSAPDAAPLALVRARSEKGVASRAIDGELATSWASRGRKALDVRLDGTPEVGAVRIALAGGATRAAVLRIALSRDGRHWRSVLQTMTSGDVDGFETLALAPAEARWVRIRCDGTTRGPVNRIAEVEVYPAL